MHRAILTTARNAHLVADWRFLGRILGLNDYDICSIEYRYDGKRERCYRALTKWQEESNGPDVETLVCHLRTSHCAQLAGNYLSLDKQTSGIIINSEQCLRVLMCC